MDRESPIITLRFSYVIEEIYNKYASLFIHQKKIIIYLVRMVEPHEFQDDYILGSWKYSTSIVHELRLRMVAILKWVNVLWSVSTPCQSDQSGAYGPMIVCIPKELCSGAAILPTLGVSVSATSLVLTLHQRYKISAAFFQQLLSCVSEITNCQNIGAATGDCGLEGTEETSDIGAYRCKV